MTLFTTPSTSGGAFAPTEHANYFFDRLAAMSVGLGSGFRVIQTTAARLEVPRILADGAASWTAEGAEITPGDPSADTITATPRKLAALSYQSNELVSDSNPDSQNMVAENLARAVALKLDAGFYAGSGTAPEIRGLKNVAGIQTNTPAANGSALTNLDPFADALGALEAENARGTAIVMHPRTWTTLTKIKDATGSNRPVLEQTGGINGIVRTIYGVPVHLSSQIAITESQGTANDATSVYVYDAPQVVVVMNRAMEVEADRSAAFSSDRVAVRVKIRADLIVPNPKAVYRISGIVAA